ncbi:MAG: DegT/DnrJ/EryC1/StrS family aminotransferase [Ignavibacteria bacterium]|nr:DegT/DnrJ/EryC1/StrS family aminotransferase [Ignavibacteria bacterium]
MNIPIAKTVFTESEFENILKPLKSGWVVQGPFVSEFELKWSEYTGAKHSVALSNCTTALHLSLAALGITRGDEVVVPSFTWVATANAVEYTGAKPVLCDIDLASFNIDPAKLESLINKNTKAIIPVHLFGLSANMNEIMAIAAKYNLAVVEDAACGFGAKYNGKHVGNIGDTGCFSFHPRKAITTGEGGMVTTNSDELAVKLRAMRDHGASISDHQRHHGNKPYLLPDFPYLGYNYRMTDIQASIGSTQMDRAVEIHSARTAIADKYDEIIDSLSWLQKPLRNSVVEHGFQAYVCLFTPEEINPGNISNVNKLRNKLMDHLQQKGISTRPGTHSVHMLDFYRNKYGFRNEDYLNSFVAAECSIALPLFPSLSDEEFNYIAKVLTEYKI